MVKVLEILKNFFQEVFKQGLGQSPKVLTPYPPITTSNAKCLCRYSPGVSPICSMKFR